MAMTVDEYLERAKGFKDRGKFEMAIELLEEAIKEHPGHDEIYFVLANYYRRKANQDMYEATRLLKKAIRLNPKPIKYLNELGLVYQWLNEYGKSESILKESLKANPRSTLAFRLLAESYLRDGQILKALDAVYEGLRYGKDNLYLSNLKEHIEMRTQILSAQIDIERLVQEGYLDEAVSLLESSVEQHNPDLVDHVISLKSHLFDLNVQLKGGTVSEEEAELYRTYISDAIRDILREI